MTNANHAAPVEGSCIPGHAAEKADASIWASLEYVGEMDDGEYGVLEHRNCPRYHSTLVVRLPARARKAA